MGSLAATLRECGRTLWVGGAIVGGDRVRGESPFGFGDDASVGVAVIAQIGSELVSACVRLLGEENRYATAALLRQILELEYLGWAFSENHDDARRWMRSNPHDRLMMWQPRHIRAQAGSRFRASDYSEHCETGGHPTPSARVLLPDHADAVPASFLWFELVVHGVSLWGYLKAAAVRHGWAEIIEKSGSVATLDARIERWRRDDPARQAARQRK